MKYIALSILLSALFISCGNSAQKDEKINDLQAKADSLESLIEDRDKSVESFFATLVSIEENLDEIGEKQTDLSIGNIENGENVEQNIIDNVQRINNLMIENKKAIDQLNEELRISGVKSESLQQRISQLMAALEKKNAEVISLNKKLANSHDAFMGLHEVYLEAMQQNQSLTNELNTVFYAIGTLQELKENNVVSNEGNFLGLGKKKLSNEINTNYFTSQSISKLDSIFTYSAKVKILTEHPENSYTITEDANNKTIVITNKTKFWQWSKYLVVITN